MPPTRIHDVHLRRLNDVTVAGEPRIRELLATGPVTLQFSHANYSADLLSRVDALCQEFGDQIEVRFWECYDTGFDASVLERLPHLQDLTLNCLTRVSSIEAVSSLTRLRRLSLGILDLNRRDLLSLFHLETLHTLYLSETRYSEIDLAPLARCTALDSLYLAGHTHGFEALGQLSRLRTLTLRSIPHKQDISVVNQLTALEKLAVAFGGGDRLATIALPRLSELKVAQVLGVSEVGDLARFPALRSLCIENQPRLEKIDLSRASPELRRLLITNCMSLRDLGSLAGLHHLKVLWLFRTAVDGEALLASPLPGALKVVRLATGRRKQDGPMDERLTELGYNIRTSADEWK